MAAHHAGLALLLRLTVTATERVIRHYTTWLAKAAHKKNKLTAVTSPTSTIKRLDAVVGALTASSKVKPNEGRIK